MSTAPLETNAVRVAITDALAQASLPIATEAQFWTEVSDVVGRVIDSLEISEQQGTSVWDAHEQLGAQWASRLAPTNTVDDDAIAYPAASEPIRGYLVGLEEEIAHETGLDAQVVRDALSDSLAQANLPIRDETQFWNEMAEVVGTTIDALQLSEVQGESIWNAHETLGHELYAADSSPLSPPESPTEFDVNQDGVMTALDALVILNHLGESGGFDEGQSVADFGARFDVNGDGKVSALDVLHIINTLGRTEPSSPQNEAQVDSFFELIGSDQGWDDERP